MAGFMQSLLGPLCTIDLEFASGPNARPPVTVKGESGKAETLPLCTANDTVRGQARSALRLCSPASAAAACRARCAALPTHMA